MRRLILLATFLLVLAYLSVLVMSTGHLAEWYRHTLGPLPTALAWGLAASLEAVAFLLSLVSNVIPGATRWAGPGAIAALGLVWAGNYLSMRRVADPAMPGYEVLLASTFVPVGTYVVGKTIGELSRHLLHPDDHRAEKARRLAADLLHGGPITHALVQGGTPKTEIARALVQYLAGYPEALESLLKEVPHDHLPKPAAPTRRPHMD